MSTLIVVHTALQFCCWLGFVYLFVSELRS